MPDDQSGNQKPAPEPFVNSANNNQKKRRRGALFLQLLLVTMAFLLLVVSSSIYVRNLLRDHLSRDAEDTLTKTKLEIESTLTELQTTLVIVSNTVRSMLLQGSSFEEVDFYLNNISSETQTKSIGLRFESNYDPKDSPWYTAAVEAGGDIAVTPIYLNSTQDGYLVTYVRLIFDNSGNPLGVVFMEVPLEHIRNSVVNMHVTRNGYGVLFDDNLDVIAYPSPEIIGRNARDIGGSFSLLAAELESGKDIFERELISYMGERTVTFTMRLDNGWILTIGTPKAEYYKELQDMELIIGGLGVLFTVVLLIILIRIDLAKVKSDEQNRRQSILLAEMEKMHEADERSHLMLDTMPFGANYIDRNFNNIACNEESVRMFGLADKNEYLKKFYELSPEYQTCGRLSRDLAVEYIEKAFEEGSGRFEWMHQKPDGELIPCEISLRRVMYKGEYTVLAYVRDLRELKAAIAEKQEADERTQLMFDASPLGCQLWNRNLDIIECNQETLNLFDMHSKQEFFDKFFELSPEYQSGGRLSKEIIAEYINKAFAEGYLRFEWMHQKLNGEPVPAEIILVRIKHKSEYEIAAYIRDLRELKAMLGEIHNAENELRLARDIAEENNKTKSKFLATMSHEIRTPMNVILGVTESQLLTGSLSPETKDAFEKIFVSGDLLLHIINDILDLSKIEAGKFDLNPAGYEVLSLINDAANMNFMQFGSKPIKFELNVDENIPLYLFGDELRIKQILNNLLSNAFKYTDSGSVVLSFSAENMPAGDRVMLVINIQDTGQGMTPEQISKLFDEYARFNLEANRTTVGTGLGMAVTRNLVRLMEGEITVDSIPGTGSTFNVRLPQKKGGPGLLGREAVENIQNLQFFDNVLKRKNDFIREPMPYGRVLVVDDMRSNIDVAILLLSPYQLQIDTAESGFEAIEKIKNGCVYDLVFMDHMMPKMDGMETVRNMRNLGYVHPIFALTANAVTGQQEIFLANGFDGFISKPIDIRQLNETLNKFIRDRERSRTERSNLHPAPSAVVQKPAADPGSLRKINIPGLDVAAGLALFGGDMDIYASALRSYIKNVSDLLDLLRSVSEESLPDYVIKVHGLKGISAGIGAHTVMYAALDLETKGKSGDLAGVLEQNGVLLENAGALVSALQSWFDEQESQSKKPRLPFPDRVLLSRLGKCCEAYDMKGIDDIMDELESADYETDASLVIWLRERINDLDFSSAAARISAYEVESP